MLETVLEDLVLSDKDFHNISKIVYEHCGINLHTGKRELVRARLAKRLRQLGIRTFSDYINYTLNDPTGHEFTALIDSISTNLTSFFRENQHFEYLEKIFYPEMIAKKRSKSDFRIRAWSAGCSSGEEPYTIAITLLDMLEGQGRWDVKILASDISTQMLERAKKGVYDNSRIAPVSPQQRKKYLTLKKIDSEDCFEVKQQLRDIIAFVNLNLMTEWPIKGPIDFIFCRNVMIYFDKLTQERLVNRYWDLLDHGGLLFTGHSESLTGIEHKFKYIQPTIYAKPQR